MTYKVLSIDPIQKSMVIDWGNGVVLNHDIPLYILENPDIPLEQKQVYIELMRPPVPIDLPVPDDLLTLVQVEVEPEPTLDDLKARKRVQIDEWRVRAEQKGLVYTFPGGQVDCIQLRHERDLANVNGQVSAAMILQAEGVTDPVLPLRAESNVTYMLTPAQMLATGMAVNQFVGQGYSTSWALKERVELATSAAQLEDIVWPA
jgi:hypothetical protein